jgi:UDP-glucose 4-epimerase
LGAASCASYEAKRSITVKTIIVTGCAGLLGSHFTRHLINKGYRVVGIDDLSGGYQDYLPKEATSKQFEFVPLDLSKLAANGALNVIFHHEKPRACFHFAAYAAEGLSPFIRHYNYTNNVLASANIINACINYNTKLIFTSSMAVYGNQPTPFNEGMWPRPIDPYGVAKYAVEMDIAIAGEQHGLRYNIVRPHNVVGIYQNIWDKYRNVVGIFIRRALDNEPLLIYGDGTQTRAFSDIKYYMSPFEALIDWNDGETYNIGADQEFTICHLANTVCQVARTHGINPKLKHVEPRHEVQHAWCDHSKAKDELGFKDDTDLESLVSEMFKWALTQPKRPQKKMPYEVEKGIYDYWK